MIPVFLWHIYPLPRDPSQYRAWGQGFGVYGLCCSLWGPGGPHNIGHKDHSRMHRIEIARGLWCLWNHVPGTSLQLVTVPKERSRKHKTYAGETKKLHEVSAKKPIWVWNVWAMRGPKSQCASYMYMYMNICYAAMQINVYTINYDQCSFWKTSFWKLKGCFFQTKWVVFLQVLGSVWYTFENLHPKQQRVGEKLDHWQEVLTSASAFTLTVAAPPIVFRNSQSDKQMSISTTARIQLLEIALFTKVEIARLTLHKSFSRKCRIMDNVYVIDMVSDSNKPIRTCLSVQNLQSLLSKSLSFLNFNTSPRHIESDGALECCDKAHAGKTQN